MAKKSTAPAQAATQDEDELPMTAVVPRGKDAVIQSLQDQLAGYAEANQPLPEPTEPPAETPEESTFKKRYGDLRRHAQQRENDLTKEMATLRNQVQQLTQAASQPMPSTKEEFEAWRMKYPQIASFVEIIADEKATARAAQLQEELTGVKQNLKQTETEKALATLHVLVPNIDDTLKSLEYKNWFANQPMFVQEELNTSEDPHRIAYFMGVFAAQTSTRQAPRKDNSNKLAALDTSVKNTGSTPGPNAGKYKFTQSQIAKMSTQDYEKHEEEIIAARNAGQIMDDMTKRNSVFEM